MFSASCRDRMSMLLSGVRSSCDMLARNSDLYFEVSASCSAFSSISQRASSTSRFLASTSAFCRASRAAFSCNSSLVLLQLFLLALQQFFRLAQRFGLLLELFVRLLEFVLLTLQFGRQRLRLLQQIFGSGIGCDRVEHDADTFRQLIEEGRGAYR